VVGGIPSAWFMRYIDSHSSLYVRKIPEDLKPEAHMDRSKWNSGLVMSDV
jgi:hypothetical protein